MIEVIFKRFIKFVVCKSSNYNIYVYCLVDA